MNILLINHYAGSPAMGMEYRPWYMAREWVKAGHQVTIVAATNAHVRTVQPRTSHKFQEEITDGITYLWVKTPPYEGNGAKRILNMFSFYRKLKCHARKLAMKYKPDAVIASSTYPMDNYAAAKIAKFSGAKHFYEVHDLWPLSPMELGGYKASHPFIKYLQRAEDFAYKRADGVISMLPKTLEYMQSRGLKPEKWHYVPNGIDVAEWNTNKAIPDEISSELNKIRTKHQFVIGYTGSHGISNALENLMDAIKIINDPQFAFVLFGKGPEKEKLKEMASGCSNIYFFEPVAKNQVPDLLSHFDALFIGWKKQSLYRFGVSPNKLFDYMMAGKPVIQAIDAGNDPVAESGCGISIEPENPQALADAIVRVKNMSDAERLQMGHAGRTYVLKHHDYKVLAEKCLNILSGKND